MTLSLPRPSALDRSASRNTVSGIGAHVTASAPGASSIEVHVHLQQSQSEPGYIVYSNPLETSRKTFFGWLAATVALVAIAGLSGFSLALIIVPVLAFICAHAAFEHFSLRRGTSGFGGFTDFALNPKEWWPSAEVHAAEPASRAIEASRSAALQVAGARNAVTVGGR